MSIYEFFAWWLGKRAGRRSWTGLSLAIGLSMLLLGGAALAVYTIVKFLE